MNVNGWMDGTYTYCRMMEKCIKFITSLNLLPKIFHLLFQPYRNLCDKHLVEVTTSTYVMSMYQCVNNNNNNSERYIAEAVRCYSIQVYVISIIISIHNMRKRMYVLANTSEFFDGEPASTTGKLFSFALDAKRNRTQTDRNYMLCALQHQTFLPNYGLSRIVKYIIIF